MFPALTASLLLASPGAPVPKSPPPDPNGYAYVGVKMADRGESPRLRIDSPEDGTPAALAGLQDGDEIVRFGHIFPTSFNEFADYVLDLRPGTRVRTEIRRNGETKVLWVTLLLRPPPPEYPDPDFSRKRRPPPPPRPNDGR